MTKFKRAAESPGLEFLVDKEHSGVRMVGCLTFLIGTVASFLILNTFVPNGGLIVIGAALAIAVALTYAADHLSKTYWPSNRAIQFVDDIILLVKGGSGSRRD